MAAKDTKTTNPTETDAYKAMLDLLTDEERENLARLTGQGGGGGGTKTPVVKINYKERADASGKKVAKGNFVLGQSNKIVDGKKILEHAGTDLGNSLDCVILKTGTQFSFWHDDPKKRCSSQIITEYGEIPVGFNLKCRCNDKSCERRKDGTPKADRCVNQYVVYLRLPAGTRLPDGTDCPIAIMYIKGTSYKPFQDYLNDTLKGIPSIAVITKFSTEESEQGSTIFFTLNMEKGDMVPTAVFKENFQLVTGVNTQLLEYKAEQAKKIASSSTYSGSTYSAPEAELVKDDADISW